MFLPEVLKNTLAQGIGRIGSIIVSIVLTGLLYRAFGEEGFGAYAFISAFVLLFAHISDWGTNIITVREASSKVAERPVIFGTTLILRLLLSLLSFLAVNVVIRINPAWFNLVLPTTVASLVLIFLSFKTSAAMIFQVLTRLELSALTDFIASLAFLVLAALSIALYKDNLNTLMFAWFLATALSGMLGLFLALKLARVVWKFDVKVAQNIFRGAVPTGALLITFSLYNRVDIIILQHFGGSQIVAPYALAYKIFDNSVLGAAFLMNALFPHLAREFVAGASENLRNYFQKAFNLLLFAGLALFLFILVFAPVIINILSGTENHVAIPLLRILGLGLFIAYFNHLSGFSLIAFGKQQSSLLIAIFALAFNVLANIIFVPLYSYYASAWITVATEGLVLLTSFFVIWKTTGLLPFKNW